MRRGEVAGLRWTDVDLAGGRIKNRKPRIAVRHKVHVSEPKTAKGRRWLALDPATVAALREHRKRQAEARLAVGPGWTESGWCSPGRTGASCTRSASTDGSSGSRRAGLPSIRLHDVRHSYATAALAAGVPAKVVSERLGHANIAITMDLYSHVLPSMDDAAARTVATLILDEQNGPDEVAVSNP
jgi:integrase